MSNAQSKTGLLSFDGAGGFDGPFYIKSIIVAPTEAAGTFTFRSTNSASGDVLVVLNNTTAGSLQFDIDQTVAGVYMNTGFPTGGKAYILVG